MLATAARIVWIGTAALAGCDRVFELEDIPVQNALDASSFDPDRDCPASYTLTSPQPTRYRVVAMDQSIEVHDAVCESDAPGLSHLAAIESRGERVALEAALNATGAYRWYLGAVQDTNAAAVGEGWLWLNGSPVDPALWHSAEPNDADGTENLQEQFMILQSGWGLADFEDNASHHALCECDGRAITQEARMAFDAALRL